MLGHLISALGLAALKGEATAAAQRAARRTAAWVAIGILWVAAVGFLIAALTIWLAGWLGGIAACVIIAAAFVVIGLIVQIAMAMTSRRRQRTEFNLSAPGLSASGSASGPATDIGALAVIAVVGWLLGRQMTKK
jgi:hypothetical protein